jgi:hypothetical protein
MKVPEPLQTVARNLGDLCDKVVFVGGMIRSLLVSDPAAGAARPTDDVDLIVELPDRVAHVKLGAELRARGFSEANEEGAPICRWKVEGVRVDVMPVDPEILGFSNVWYFGAHERALAVPTPDGTLRILDGPHFCATKLEAFASRGDGDLYHHDLEDFIALVDGRPELVAEIRSSPKDVRDFLASETALLLSTAAFVEALPGHLGADTASQSRLPLVVSRLRELAALAEPAPLEKRSTSQPRPGVRGAPPLAPPPASAHTFRRSTNLRAAWYDDATGTLTIEFRNGSRYNYEAVPPSLYSGLLLAASAGRYHHQWIRTRFRYVRVR